MATASATHARSHRFRAPPPSPIATGKGLRSAAVDDLVLTEYLEDSLRVPDLNLPESYFPSRSPLKALAEVDLHSLVSGDGLAVRQVLAAAAEIGAVRVAGGGAPLAEEARAAIEACGVVFETPEGEKSKGALGQQCYGWRDALAEEFYWYRSRSPEMEQLLQRTWPDSYRTLRERMENVAARLETVAECIANILSKHFVSQTPSRVGEIHSILCLRKYESHHSRSNMREFSDAKSLSSHALSLHISGDDHEFCIRCPEGSAIFEMSAGDIVVTIGKPLQEWSNGELKIASGEPLFQPTDNPFPSFTLEYMCSPLVLSHEPEHGTKTISLIDQLLIVLVLSLIYSLWSCVFS
ncbi:unnamed protein product [Musa hybrid cultivar]